MLVVQLRTLYGRNNIGIYWWISKRGGFKPDPSHQTQMSTKCSRLRWAKLGDMRSISTVRGSGMPAHLLTAKAPWDLECMVFCWAREDSLSGCANRYRAAGTARSWVPNHRAASPKTWHANGAESQASGVPIAGRRWR